MDTFNTLVNENNKTLAFIEAKDYSNALESSLLALCYLQGANISENSNSEGPFPTTLDQCMMMLLPTNDSSSNKITSMSEDTQHELSFLFDQGILLPRTITDWKVIAPILIFNAAVAHHLLPPDYQDTRSISTTTLQRAKRLYELAYGAGQRASNNILFRFALINNLAVIERQMGNMEQSERYFQGLLSTYMQFLDRAGNQNNGTEQLRYLQGFLLNLSFYNDNSPAA